MPRIFISHSSKDRDFVESELMPFLRNQGVEPWYSRDDIEAAAHWEATILKGLRESEWFLVVLTPGAVVSEWVRTEVSWALSERKGRVIPLLRQSCDVDDLHLALRRIQWVDIASDAETGWTALGGVVKRMGGVPSREVAPQVEAPSVSRSDANADRRARAGAVLAIASQWYLLDLLDGELIPVTKFPFEIGADPEANLRLRPSDDVAKRHCSILRASGKTWLTLRSLEARVHLDGLLMENPVELDQATDYSIQIGSQLFLIRSVNNVHEWQNRINVGLWMLQDVFTGETAGPAPFASIPKIVQEGAMNPSSTVTSACGAEKGFYVSDILDLTERAVEVAEPWVEKAKAQSEESSLEGEEQVSTCPHCWSHFGRKDVLWIARHPSLLGADPDTGEAAMLRFRPTSFNDQGRAVDPMGVPCADVACPHCKHRLPDGLLDSDRQSISIVGAPSSGKSYYLATAVQTLELILHRYFGLAFQSGDPEGNAPFQRMRAQLFSGSDDPFIIRLDKTDPGGDVYYEKQQRQGRSVILPRPLSFSINSFREELLPVSLGFYNISGEHFGPLLHQQSFEELKIEIDEFIGKASTLLCLFDPALCEQFRTFLNPAPPTMGSHARGDIQDQLFQALGNRLKRELGLDAVERLAAPLGVLVAKCDLWMDHLESGGKPIANPVAENRLDLDLIDENSDRVRDLLRRVNPSTVDCFEAIAEEVIYFPVSSFGHCPEVFTATSSKGGGEVTEKIIGPVPGRLDPMFTEVPILWALSRNRPDLIPAVRRKS